MKSNLNQRVVSLLTKLLFKYNFFFFLSGFSFTDTGDSQDSKGREGTIFYSTLPLPSRPRTFRHLVATFYVRWLSYIFNCTACIYQTVTRWDLPPYRITIWLIDDVKLVFLCLLDDLILSFCFSNLDTGNRWARTHTLVLQANRLTKCTSHPRWYFIAPRWYFIFTPDDIL